MVMTPVGARCPKCARVSRLPTYSLSLRWYLRAIGASLLGAVVLGLIWGLLARLPFIGFFGFFLAAGAGYVIGEITSRAVNRKRSNWLAVTGCLGFMLSYFISGGSLFFWLPPHINLFELAAIAIGLFLAQSRLR